MTLRPRSQTCPLNCAEPRSPECRTRLGGWSSTEAAPLLCAGLIGYRSLVLAEEVRRLGLYGTRRMTMELSKTIALGLQVIMMTK